MSKPAAQAQGPSIDPSFIPSYAYRPASVQQAAQQTDGKYLLLSDAVRAGGSSATGLLRLLADGSSPDLAFQTNVSSLQGTCRLFSLLPNGQILLVSDAALTLGSVTRQRLLRLNTDGTPDAGFNAGSGAGFSNFYSVAAQPDGKVLVAGDFTTFNGSAAGRLVRLNTDGSLDAAFQTALGTGFSMQTAAIAVQTDGKIVVTGAFSSINGTARQAIVRLLPTGAIDTSFTPAVPSGGSLLDVAVQPDGKLLVATYNPMPGWPALTRLNANGTLDTSFQNGTNFTNLSGLISPAIQVQPDGKILVLSIVSRTYNGTAIGKLVRLLPNGGLDPAFANTSAVPANSQLNTMQLLPNGKVLVALLSPTRFAPAGSAATGIALLNTDGSRDPAFVPLVQAPASVNALVQQPDGKYVVGGNFTEIGGVAAGYVARLNTDGTLDAGFTAAARASDVVTALALQPDGKVLVGGTFDQLAGGVRQSLGRLLPNGALDTGFAPVFVPTVFGQSNVELLAVQNDGRVLVKGTLTEASAPLNIFSQLLCLNGVTGQRDTSFPVTYQADALLVQPDGNLVIGGSNNISGSRYPILRLLPSGTLDPSFTQTAVPTNSLNFATQLARDAAGRLYASGSFTSFGGLPMGEVVRLLPNGTPDPGFAAGAVSTRIQTLAVQPNGRVLVGGQVGTQNANGTLRLLSNGAFDLSYNGATGPNTTVNSLLVQADGAIMAAGSFTTVSGISYNGLVRLLDANVLSVSNQKLAARTQAWPVPAHGRLNLALDAASRPQRVELLDALGRVVLTQVVSQPELTLDTSPLRAGAYLLRVHYAGGTTTRRVMLE
nr:T9SS type A sorting domain-containing protein [Hymenobacter negativus]